MCRSIFLGWGLMDCLCLQKTHVWIQPEVCLLCFLISLVGSELSYNPVYIEAKSCLLRPNVVLLWNPTQIKVATLVWTVSCSIAAHISNRLQGIVPLYHISTIVAKSRSLRCVFTAYIYYFCTIPLRSDMAHPFPKIPNFNLVKKLSDWTISAVPSISKLIECLHSSSALLPMELCTIRELDRRARKPPLVRAQTHILYTNTLCGEKQGANYGILWQGTAVGKSVSPPGRPQCTRHTASMCTDSDRIPMIPRYLETKAQWNP